MRTNIRYTLAVFCFALSSILPTHGHDEEGAGEHRDVYITEAKGDFLYTTHDNLFIFSQRREGKPDLLAANEDELLRGILLVPIKWREGQGVYFRIYSKENGKRALLGAFPLVSFGKTLHLTPECESYIFEIRKKNFDQSIIMLRSDTESIYLHLYPDPNKKAEIPTPMKPSE